MQVILSKLIFCIVFIILSYGVFWLFDAGVDTISYGILWEDSKFVYLSSLAIGKPHFTISGLKSVSFSPIAFETILASSFKIL